MKLFFSLLYSLSLFIFPTIVFAANSDISIQYIDQNGEVVCSEEGTGSSVNGKFLNGIRSSIKDSLDKTNDGTAVKDCSPESIQITLTSKQLDALSSFGNSALGPLSGILDGFDINPFDNSKYTPLEKPGIMMLIVSESGSITEDLMGLDTNGLSDGIPVRWYIEAYEIWDQETGQRYRYPTINIPITEGVIQFDIHHKFDLNDTITNAGVGGTIGGISGATLGGNGSLATGIAVGGALGATAGSSQKTTITLDIKNNYISKVTTARKINAEDIENTSISNLIITDTIGMKLKLANGIEMNASVLGDSMDFFGQARSITQDGLSVFDPNDIEGISREGSVAAFMVDVVNWFLGFIGAIAVFILIYAGFLMIWARGDDGVTEKATDMIRYSLLGIIIIAASYSIINTVINFTGGTYRATFELRDNAGGRLIGVNITEGNCATTTLPLTGQIDICNQNKYLIIESESPLLPRLIWPIKTIEAHCGDLKIGVYACLNARNGDPRKFLTP